MTSDDGTSQGRLTRCECNFSKTDLIESCTKMSEDVLCIKIMCNYRTMRLSSDHLGQSLKPCYLSISGIKMDRHALLPYLYKTNITYLAVMTLLHRKLAAESKIKGLGIQQSFHCSDDILQMLVK